MSVGYYSRERDGVVSTKGTGDSMAYGWMSTISRWLDWSY